MIILFYITGLLLLTANKVWLLSAAEKSGKSGAKPGEMLIKLRIRFYQVQCGRQCPGVKMALRWQQEAPDSG